MNINLTPLQFPFEAFADVISAVSTIILLGLFIAVAGFVYKSVRGDGIQWPSDTTDGSVPTSQDTEAYSREDTEITAEESMENGETTEGVSRSDDDDDEWKYY